MDFIPHGREIVSAFIRLGATSYGGPAIMGVMQAELQERRQWLSKPRFLEGLALLNMLPGVAAFLVLAGALGLGLFYSRRLGVAALGAAGLAIAAIHRWSPPAAVASVDARVAESPGLAGLATFFLEVGALTVGGGLAMIAFIQARVVET